MRAAIVADSGGKIGLGHLGRCLALAQALKHFHGVKVTFFSVDAASRDWVRRKGFAVQKTFHGRWDILVADSYRFTAADHRKFRRAARTLCMVDDMGQVRFPCEWVLNSSVLAQKVSYAGAPSLGFLLGPKFHPLRMEYARRRPGRKTGRTPKSVLVMLGGTNGWGLLGRMVGTVRRTLPKARLHVVVGPYVPIQVGKWDPKISVHHSPSNMRMLLEKCDVAVSGGGQTLYELAYMGVPTVAVQLAENQRYNMADFERAGTILSAGRWGAPALMGQVRTALGKLAKSASLRAVMSARGRRLVDGRGARRVADLLLKDVRHA